MRTNKTLWSIVGAVALTMLTGVAGYCAEEAAAPTEEISMPKFEEFNPDTYKGETGKIVLPCEATSVNMSLQRVANGKPGNFVALQGKGSELVAPVGSYTLGYYGFEVKAKNGTQWMLQGGGQEGSNAVKVEVKSGESAKLDISGKFAAAIKSGKTGTVTSPYPSAESFFLGICSTKSEESEIMIANCTGKSAAVPAGDFYLAMWSATMKDKSGKMWSISSSANSEADLKPLSVKADTEIKLKASEPLTASVKVEQSGDQWSMSLEMVGADGAKYAVQSADGEAEAPGFQVLNKSGKVLASGKFQYG